MTLFVLAIAFIVGVGLGSALVEAGLARCGLSPWIYAVRSRGLTLIERMLPEPHAALAAGILLRIDAGIPDTLYDRFNATGTSHVLVIAGRNMIVWRV